ncbi:ABC transporter ATPase, partial [Clostridium botulinum]|nr:ABC transporter ATPase [Clostridium botulinum]
MYKLDTIQKREKLNKVYPHDEEGNGGANHAYLI